MQQPVMRSTRSNDVTDVHKILDKSCSRLECVRVTGDFFISGLFDSLFENNKFLTQKKSFPK